MVELISNSWIASGLKWLSGFGGNLFGMLAM